MCRREQRRRRLVRGMARAAALRLGSFPKAKVLNGEAEKLFPSSSALVRAKILSQEQAPSFVIRVYELDPRVVSKERTARIGPSEDTSGEVVHLLDSSIAKLSHDGPASITDRAVDDHCRIVGNREVQRALPVRVYLHGSS